MRRLDASTVLAYSGVVALLAAAFFFISAQFTSYSHAQGAGLQPSEPPPQQQAKPSEPPTQTKPTPAAAPAAKATQESDADATPNENAAATKSHGAGSGISELEGFLEPFIYDVANRRDPFIPYAEYVPTDTSASGHPLSPAQRFELDQLKLVGIMWDVKDPRAMFVDPSAEVLVLGRDEGIGNHNGYIASIREGEVVVVEALRKRGDVVYKTRVLRIER